MGGARDNRIEVAEDGCGLTGSCKQPLAGLVKDQPVITPASHYPQLLTASAQKRLPGVLIRHVSAGSSGSPALVTQLKSLKEF